MDAIEPQQDPTCALYHPARHRSLKSSADAVLGTRFKRWQRLVGSAVEYAALWAAPEKGVDFTKLFVCQEADDEESADLGDFLVALREMFGRSFTAVELANELNKGHAEGSDVIRAFLFAGKSPDYQPSQFTVSKKLRALKDNPAQVGSQTLILKSDADGKVTNFWVDTK
jgi:hypothetical protein